jgi:hypothetical protein
VDYRDEGQHLFRAVQGWQVIVPQVQQIVLAIAQ